jgi:hypothetical protein
MNRSGSHHPQNSTAPTHERRGGKAMLQSVRALYVDKSAARIPENWRNRLPDPAAYYGARVEKLGKRSGVWTMALCPFHDDHKPSFGVKLASERGRCDIVAFHMRVTGYGFNQAVRDLLGMQP